MTRHVIIQKSGSRDQFEYLICFVDEGTPAKEFKKESADLIVDFDLDQGWIEQDKYVTFDSTAIGMIVEDVFY